MTDPRRSLVSRPGVAAMAILLLAAGAPAARAQGSGELKLLVAEVARSVDFSRGREQFLTVAVEITGADPVRLRRVQPLRDDFRLLAGKKTLPCRWLRGGTLPEDPSRLRFTLGFSMPPPGTRQVSLRADLPRLDEEAVLELRLADLRTGNAPQERSGPAWRLTVSGFDTRPYLAPALPPRGYAMSKGGPVDVRVFRKGSPKEPDPDRALTLSVRSEQVGLYDGTVDVSGHLLVERGPVVPLLSASMRRDPSRTVAKPPYPPRLYGEFHFRLPARTRATGAVLRLHRRPSGPARRSVTVAGLPVPGN